MPGICAGTTPTLLSQSMKPNLSEFVEDEEIEPYPLVSNGMSSSSLDKKVTPSSPCPSDDHKQYQELLQRVAIELKIPLEEVQDTQRDLLDILQPSGPLRVALPVNQDILVLPDQYGIRLPLRPPPKESLQMVFHIT